MKKKCGFKPPKLVDKNKKDWIFFYGDIQNETKFVLIWVLTYLHIKKEFLIRKYTFFPILINIFFTVMY